MSTTDTANELSDRLASAMAVTFKSDVDTETFARDIRRFCFDYLDAASTMCACGHNDLAHQADYEEGGRTCIMCGCRK